VFLRPSCDLTATRDFVAKSTQSWLGGLFVIGKLLDRRYRILEFLGAGSFGQTYLAEDIRRPGCPKCVIKHLRPIRNTSKSILAARRRFLREAHSLEKLGKHDRVPQLLAYFEAKEHFFLVEDYIPGNPLSQEIVPGAPLSESQTIALLQEVLEILDFVHSNGVIHRDVTPANIIRRAPDGKLVLIDFGAVKEITAELLEKDYRTIATGTPAYMPVEQFRGQPLFNSDIYALGTIAIQALTGASVKDLPHLKNPSNSSSGETLWRLRVRINPKLADVIDKMVRDDWKQRYQSAREVLEELNTIAATPAPPELPATIIEFPKTLPPSATQNSQLGEQTDSLLRKITIGGVAVLLVGGLALIFHSQIQMQANQFYNRAAERAKQGDARGSVEDYTRAIQYNPSDVGAYFSRGKVRLQLEDFQGALEDFSEVIRLNPSDATAYENRCVAQLNLKQLEEALSDCTQAIRLASSPTAYKNRCSVHLQLGAHRRAIEDCTQAIQLNPNDAGAYSNRALARSAVEDQKLAIEDFTKALQLNPNDTGTLPVPSDTAGAGAYLNRCIAQVNLSNFPAALSDCTQAIQLNPNLALAHSNRCIAQRNLSQHQKAIVDCTRALELNPSDAGAYSNRGLASYALGDKAGALEDFTQAIRLSGDAGAYSNRGNANYDLGDYKQALADYTQAIQLQPDSEQAYYGRGRTRLQFGDKPAAIQDFQKSSQLCLDKRLTACYNSSQNQIKHLQP